jgi:hypothetical protein
VVLYSHRAAPSQAVSGPTISGSKATGWTAISQAVRQAVSAVQLQQFTDWRLLAVPSTGDPVELTRYPHQADCLQAREAEIRRAWAERQQVPSLECYATVGWWVRLYKAYNTRQEWRRIVYQLARERFPDRDLKRNPLTSQELQALEDEVRLRRAIQAMTPEELERRINALEQKARGGPSPAPTVQDQPTADDTVEGLRKQ